MYTYIILLFYFRKPLSDIAMELYQVHRINMTSSMNISIKDLGKIIVEPIVCYTYLQQYYTCRNRHYKEQTKTKSIIICVINFGNILYLNTNTHTYIYIHIHIHAYAYT